MLDDGFWFDDDVEGAVKEGEVLLEHVGKFWLAMYKLYLASLEEIIWFEQCCEYYTSSVCRSIWSYGWTKVLPQAEAPMNRIC